MNIDLRSLAVAFFMQLNVGEILEDSKDFGDDYQYLTLMNFIAIFGDVDEIDESDSEEMLNGFELLKKAFSEDYYENCNLCKVFLTVCKDKIEGETY